MVAAPRTVFACVSDCYASSWYAVRVRLSAGWPEVEMAVIIKWVGVMHPISIFDQTPRLAPCPLASRPRHTAQAAGRTRTHSMMRKERMKETRLGGKCRGDSHAEGGGACPRPTKINMTPARRRAPAALGCHDPATPNAQAATPPSHRTSRSRCGDGSLSAMCRLRARRGSFFLCGVEQTPVFVRRVVVVGGLCARRREVQIWCGDGPR